MDVSNSQLLLKRNVTIKSVVTPRWKEEVQQQLQLQINQIDSQMQQLEMQAQRMVGEIQKQSGQDLGVQSQQQIENLQADLNKSNDNCWLRKIKLCNNCNRFRLWKWRRRSVPARLIASLVWREAKT